MVSNEQIFYNFKCITVVFFSNLRSKLYTVTTLWVSNFGEGIGNAFIVETVVKNIFEDVLIPRTDIYLMVRS